MTKLWYADFIPETRPVYIQSFRHDHHKKEMPRWLHGSSTYSQSPQSTVLCDYIMKPVAYTSPFLLLEPSIVRKSLQRIDFLMDRVSIQVKVDTIPMSYIEMINMTEYITLSTSGAFKVLYCSILQVYSTTCTQCFNV